MDNTRLGIHINNNRWSSHLMHAHYETYNQLAVVV